MLTRYRQIVPLLFLMLQFLPPDTLSAQASISRWEAVRPPNGPIPKGRVRCIMQDSHGFIWVGMGDGLLRYDGYTFTQYQHDPDDSTSLSADWTRCLAEDKNGDIWVGTFSGGISRYNRKTDNFTTFLPDDKNPDAVADAKINNFCFDREGRLWVATGKGLDLARPLANVPGRVSFRHFRHIPDDSLSLPSGDITDVVEDRDGRIWASTYDHGIVRMEAAPGGEASDARFIPLRAVPNDSASLGGDKVYDLQNGPRGELAVSHTRGLSILPADQLADPNPRFINLYDTDLNEPNGSSVVHRTFMGPQNRLWAVSAFGIHLLAGDRIVVSYHPEKMGLQSKGYNVFYSMLIDNSGTVWLGAQEGLFRTPPSRFGFHAIPMPPEEGPTTVTAVIRDHAGQMWLGLEDNGLLLLDRHHQPYARFRREKSDPSSLLNNFVTSIYEDSRQRIWVGTYGGGLHLCQPKRNPDGTVHSLKFKRLFIPGDPTAPLPDPYHYHLTEARDSTIWTASFYGAGHFDEASQKFEGKPVFVANAVHEGVDGTIWVATDKGLYEYQRNPDSLVKYLFPDDAPINLEGTLLTNLATDHRGRLWVGGASGLVRLPVPGDPGEWLRRSNGLADNSVRGLIADGKTGFWLCTTGTITHLDLESGAARNFDQRDGLLNERFTNRTIFRDRDGTLYFGGDLGVDYFHPDSLKEGVFDPPLVLTGFRVFNRALSCNEDGPDGLRLPKAISLLDSLELEFSHKVFSIDFAALDYRQSAAMRYRHKLEGFDEEWQKTDPGVHSVTYTNLDPGDYLFRVHALSADGQQSRREARLHLRIFPPWWRTTWAYLIYAALALGIVTLIFRLRVSAIRREMSTQARIAKARVDERDQVRASSSRDFHDEAGNKLTRISLYLGLLRQQATGEADTSPLLDKIEENLQSLSGGMRDFIWVLDPRHDNLPDLLLRLARFGDELFEASELRFRFENQLPENLDSHPDVRTKRHLLLIFKEAMHNALRHAEASEVVLRAEVQGNTLVLSLEDDGKGFDEGALERINGLRNMRERAAEMGGKLSVRSVAGQGTVWKLEMQIAEF